MTKEEAEKMAETLTNSGKKVVWIKEENSTAWFYYNETVEEYVNKLDKYKYRLGFMKDKPEMRIYQDTTIFCKEGSDILVSKKRVFGGSEPSIVFGTMPAVYSTTVFEEDK